MRFVSFCNMLSENDWADYTFLPIDVLVKRWAMCENIPFKIAWRQALGEMIQYGS